MRRRRLLIAKFLPLAAFLLIFPQGSTRAQVAPNAPKSATKFDEYGAINGEDHSARLDNFATQLQNQPTASGCIVIYGPEGEGKTVNRVNRNIIKDYLVNSRGIDVSRINTLYGGRNSDLTEPRIELWIVPRGARLPKPTKYETVIETFKGKFSDVQVWDGIPILSSAEEDCCGPPVADVTEASFADLIDQQKTAAAYIVAYNGREAMPGAWRRVVQKEVESLNKYKVDGNRLKIIFGGYAKETLVQLWVLPAGAPPPVKDAGAEKAPTEAIEVGRFSDGELGNTKNEQAVFSRLVEALKQFPELRLCLIVTIATPAETELEMTEPDVAQTQTESSEAQPETTDPAQEIPPADVTVLVEKWKIELAHTHKIDGARVVILFTTSSDFLGSHVDAWLVPPNQPLPDPNAPNQKPEGDAPINTRL
jgi:hypothetical protein